MGGGPPPGLASSEPHTSVSKQRKNRLSSRNAQDRAHEWGGVVEVQNQVATTSSEEYA